MGLTFTESISAVTVFIQGVLSFFSPCVLPLLPLYIGYLSGGTGAGAYAGKGGFDRRKVILNTLCFVAGIGFSFLLLGLGMRAVGLFFSGNQLLFARAGGIIVILFGLYQTGVFGYSSFLAGEKRLPARFDKMAMSPFTALLMGFVFSFAWTPCVGPALSGVLLMAASAKDSAAGFALVGVYTLGFSLPFLLTGIFTTSILNIFMQHKNVVRYTTRISGVLLILMGILMITGSMNNFTQYLSQISGTEEKAAEEGPEPSTETEISEPDDTAEEYTEAIAEEYSEDIAEEYSEDIAEEYTEHI
ncbi:MAG: cytochrome C biogenesis protein, partial [Lachnospiraceae bacterium]|nr:cytochrome C biogenesis protein [Lachnospiraceae bacterium]